MDFSKTKKNDNKLFDNVYAIVVLKTLIHQIYYNYTDDVK